MSVRWIAAALLLVACSSNKATGGDAGTGGDGGTGVPPVDASSHTDASSVVSGGPGCGLPSAAFCDTFDAPSGARGRAGDMDARWWSGGRLAPQMPTWSGQAFWIAAATLLPARTLDAGPTQLPACRAGLPTQVFPGQDTLVCDPNGDIPSHHLLVAVGAQNYGENSYRIRQPFDFAGRTGKIVFDAEALAGGLLGWISVEVTEDPIPVPSFSIGQGGASPYANDEGSVLPANGFEVHFNGVQGSQSGMSHLSVFKDYVETDTMVGTTNPVPLATQWGKLNHFEVTVSQKNISVYASPPAPDGVTFAPPTLLYSANVDLPFSRGYVHITTHNHATYKYTTSTSWAGNQGFNGLDAWIARWDNVGFDGPIVSQFREYEVADSLVPSQITEQTGDPPTPVMNTGWTVADVAQGPSATLRFKGVDSTGVTRARIALASAYCIGCGPPVKDFVLRYRLNGKSWHDRPLQSAELAYLTGGASQGALGQMLDVPLSDLVAGDNTLEFVTVNVPQNYPPGVVNLDLVLDTP